MLMQRREVLLSTTIAGFGRPGRVGRSSGAEMADFGLGQASVLDSRVILSLTYYDAWVFEAQGRRGMSKAFLVSSSPADGLLSTSDLTAVTAGIQRAIEALPGLRACTASPIAVTLTPPWDSGGFPSLVFDATWSVTGYNIIVDGNETPSQAWFAQQNADASNAVKTAFAGAPGVASCTQAAHPAVTPPLT